MVVKSKSPRETQEIAKKLAQKIITKRSVKHSVVIALEGELGAGKTEFTKGFAKALGVKQRITSPTFVLIKRYGFSTNYKLKTKNFLYHIDAYRLKDHLDLEMLGVKELIKEPDNIFLIEWSDRVQKIIPKKHIRIHIDHLDKTTRKITISDTL